MHLFKNLNSLSNVSCMCPRTSLKIFAIVPVLADISQSGSQHGAHTHPVLLSHLSLDSVVILCPRHSYDEQAHMISVYCKLAGMFCEPTNSLSRSKNE